MNILFAEDTDMVAEMLRTILTARGYNVVWRQNGKLALDEFIKRRELAEGEAYDCLITDYQMPVMNGVQLGVRIRERSDIPIILWSGGPPEVIPSGVFNNIIMKDNLSFWEEEDLADMVFLSKKIIHWGKVEHRDGKCWTACTQTLSNETTQDIADVTCTRCLVLHETQQR